MPSQLPSVLIVDDNRDFCYCLFDAFEAFCFDVNATHEPKTALHLLRNRSYDVALLDRQMPDIDGVTLLRRLRQLRPELVGVLVTAHAVVETPDELRRAGFLKVVQKPVEFPVLFDAVKDVFEQSESMMSERPQRDAAARTCSRTSCCIRAAAGN